MPKYVIEREFPGADRLTGADLREVARKSCDVLREMGPRITWQQSYVTENKIYCVYIADDEKAILEHAEKGGFPVDRISRVTAVIDGSTAD
ncbi:hypothetical protein GCM10027034_06730 [Ramlibacter solisilvae]|uniref:Membrane protein n=1 Tax=Ramlibacter tataouinensis TaxID=94132 RepID=A0A127JY52_9BURK|nr:DUF4242 domain-containing protein [Ramlibacter tataouinensis]AMO24928.1 membrane protein [Ramlibacter tataouinensis]